MVCQLVQCFVDEGLSALPRLARSAVGICCGCLISYFVDDRNEVLSFFLSVLLLLLLVELLCVCLVLLLFCSCSPLCMSHRVGNWLVQHFQLRS